MGTCSNLDKQQRHAFKSIMAAFVLTFYDDDRSNQENADDGTRQSGLEEVSAEYLRKYRHSKLQLLCLKGGKGMRNPQLICLLHGPGGSGKSTVLSLVNAYAREYCKHLDHPFTCQTIVVTAMSGVAVTLIHRETMHAACGLNTKGDVTEEL